MSKPLKKIVYWLILQILVNEGLSLKCEKDNNDFITNYLDETSGKLKAGELVGKGAFGEVYRIEWKGPSNEEETKIDAAVKVVKKENIRLINKEKLPDLENEATLMRKAHHTNPPIGAKNLAVYDEEHNRIPKVFGCYTDKDDTGYLVLQYIPTSINPLKPKNEDPFSIEGKNYENYMKFTNLKPKTRRELYAQMADGLHQMHERGITHGDIKPENIVFDTNEDESKWKAYIIDFGGAVEGKKCHKMFTFPYFDEYFVNYQVTNWHEEENKKEEYEYGEALDVYQLFVTMFVLEKTFWQDEGPEDNLTENIKKQQEYIKKEFTHVPSSKESATNSGFDNLNWEKNSGDIKKPIDVLRELIEDELWINVPEIRLYKDLYDIGKKKYLEKDDVECETEDHYSKVDLLIKMTNKAKERPKAIDVAKILKNSCESKKEEGNHANKKPDENSGLKKPDENSGLFGWLKRLLGLERKKKLIWRNAAKKKSLI